MVAQKGKKASPGSRDRCNSSAESGHTLAFCNHHSQKRAALDSALCGAGLLDRIPAGASCLVLRAVPGMVPRGNALPVALDPARRSLGGSLAAGLAQSIAEVPSSQIKGFQWAQLKPNSVQASASLAERCSSAPGSEVFINDQKRVVFLPLLLYHHPPGEHPSRYIYSTNCSDGSLASSEVLRSPIHRGPFQPRPFCDSRSKKTTVLI